MIQKSLHTEQLKSAGFNFIKMIDANICLHRKCFDITEADALLQTLQTSIAWEQQTLNIAGKTVRTPRLAAWHGDPEAVYTCSGIRLTPQPWNLPLQNIQDRIYELTGIRFNSVLLNLYRHERDSMAWHSDDEPVLGNNPVIASISLGATRRFQLKHKHRTELRKTDIELTHGSLLLMYGSTQHYWQHQIPKQRNSIGVRISLTFRQILSCKQIVAH